MSLQMSTEDTDAQLRALLDSFPDRPSKYEFMKSCPADVRPRWARLLAGLSSGSISYKSASPDFSNFLLRTQSFPSQFSETLEAPNSSVGSPSPSGIDDSYLEGINASLSRLSTPVTTQSSFPPPTTRFRYHDPMDRQQSFSAMLGDDSTQFDEAVERDPVKPGNSNNEELSQTQPSEADSSPSNINAEEDGDLDMLQNRGKNRRKTEFKDPEKNSLMWRMGFKNGSQHTEYVSRRREARKICNKMDFTVAWTYNDKPTRDVEIDKLLEEFQEYGYNRAICEDLVMDICQKGANVAKRAVRKEWQNQNPGQKQKPGRKPKSESSTPLSGKRYRLL